MSTSYMYDIELTFTYMLASFFFPSHLSFKNMYIVQANESMCTCSVTPRGGRGGRSSLPPFTKPKIDS